MKNTLKKTICCNLIFVIEDFTPISLNTHSLLVQVFHWDAIPKLTSFFGENFLKGKYLPVLLSKERPFSEHRLRCAWKEMRRDSNVLVQESCLLLSFYMVTGNLFLSILNRAEDQCKYISVLAHNRYTREGSKQIPYLFCGTKPSR